MFYAFDGGNKLFLGGEGAKAVAQIELRERERVSAAICEALLVTCSLTYGRANLANGRQLVETETRNVKIPAFYFLRSGLPRRCRQPMPDLSGKSPK